MKYTIQKGTNKHLIIHLHGTGGTSEGLFNIGKHLDSEATIIGIDGDIFEHGMRRYFARYSDGSFDLESLKENTDRLYKTINEIIENNMFSEYTVTVLGYSNGANIAQNLIKEYRTVISNYILFHPSTVRMNSPFIEQKNLKIFMTSGENDPYISKEDFKLIEDALEKAHIHTEVYTHERGHELIHEEIHRAKSFLLQNK